MYKGVIFDLDGTLINTIEDIIDSCNTVMEYFGFVTYSYEEGKYLVGRGIYTLMERALPQDKINEEFLEECVMMMKEEYAKRYTNKTRPYNGIVELLDTLKEKNIPFAIHTNKPHKAANEIVKNIFNDYDFVKVFGYIDEETKKPNPQRAFEIANIFNVQPEECIFVGDSSSDINTAKNANMLPVAVTWGFRTKEELLEAGAEVFVDEPLGLLDIVIEGESSINSNQGI